MQDEIKGFKILKTEDVAKYYDESTKIISMPDDDICIPPGGVGYIIYHKMKTYSNKIAQIYAPTDTKEDYSSLFQRCVRIASALKSFGIKSGDVISICSSNNLYNSASLIASQFIGAIVANLDPTLTKKETKHLLSIVKPKLIFISLEAEDLISSIVKESNEEIKIVAFGESDDFISFDKLLEEYKGSEDNFEPFFQKNLQEISLVLFSSGSTGLPKGICLSHEFMVYVFLRLQVTVFLGFASLYWATSSGYTLAAFYHGNTKIIVPKFDPKLTWNYIDKYKVESMFIAPCDVIQLYRNKPKDHISPLKVMTIGGSPMSKDYLEKVIEAMPKTEVLFMYGQTELFYIFQNYEGLGRNKIGTVGIPLPGKTYKIVDPDTEEILGFNQKGELRIKTKWQLSGYYNQDSSDAWDKEGYLKSGDISYYDEDFCFYVVDRIKEMFKYRSWHIVPAKLEAILMTHPDVKAAVIVGIPHLEDDNHILGVVVPIEGHKSSPEDIKKFVEDQMDDRHKLRGGLIFVKEFPTTPSGKIKKRVIRDMYMAGKISN